MSVSLRELVKPIGKKCGMAIHLRNKVNRQKHMVIGALCGSWKCDTCGPYLRRKWVEHLSGKLSGANAVYVSLVSKVRWQSFATRIRRAGGQFATVEQDSGVLTVFTTLPVGEQVSQQTAISMLEKAIWGSVAEHRPVHTSRGWGLPKDAPKMSDWERVEKLPITVDEAQKAVEVAGFQVRRFWSDLRTGFVVELDEDAEFPNLSLQSSIGRGV